MHFYKEPKWIMALALLLAAVSFTFLVVTSYFRDEQVDENTSDITKIEKILANSDELVEFVREVREETNGDEPVDLQIFVDLLCASDDPIRQQACSELPQNPLGTTTTTTG